MTLFFLDLKAKTGFTHAAVVGKCYRCRKWEVEFDWSLWYRKEISVYHFYESV